MPNSNFLRFTGAGLLTLAVMFSSTASGAPSLEPLQGTWSVTKTNREGQRYFQIIEIKQNKLTFQILDAEKEVRLFARGTIKADQAGPFNYFTLSDIEGGRSAEDLEPVEGQRASVYTLRDGNLIIASNLDEERENERPSLDTYVRGAPGKAAAAAPGGGTDKLVGQWKLNMVLGEQSIDYGLRVAESNGKLEATLISPRSGNEYKAKSVAYRDRDLVMEVDREFDGNTVTVVYRGKLAEETLSGQVAVKGYEDQYRGEWKARR